MQKDVSVHSGDEVCIPGSTFHLALNSRSFLALTFLRGFFVVFTATQFRQDAGFLAGALETSQGGVEMFIFSDFYAWQNYLPSTPADVVCGVKNRHSAGGYSTCNQAVYQGGAIYSSVPVNAKPERDLRA
jgi:hypothetical protein